MFQKKINNLFKDVKIRLFIKFSKIRKSYLLNFKTKTQISEKQVFKK